MQPVGGVTAVQLTLIWLDDVAVAVSPVGAEGTAVHPALADVVAVAWAEAADAPAPSTASIL